MSILFIIFLIHLANMAHELNARTRRMFTAHSPGYSGGHRSYSPGGVLTLHEGGPSRLLGPAFPTPCFFFPPNFFYRSRNYYQMYRTHPDDSSIKLGSVDVPLQQKEEFQKRDSEWTLHWVGKVICNYWRFALDADLFFLTSNFERVCQGNKKVSFLY